MGKVPVVENGLFVQCSECREYQWWAGKGRARYRACNCTPEPVDTKRKITRRSASAKGKRGERETEHLLQGAGFDSQRTAGSGSTGSRNSERAYDTDVVARLGPLKMKVESKRLARVPGLTSFLGMMAGSDLLRVRQDHATLGFWFMSDKQFKALASLAAEALEAKR